MNPTSAATTTTAPQLRNPLWDLIDKAFKVVHWLRAMNAHSRKPMAVDPQIVKDLASEIAGGLCLTPREQMSAFTSEMAIYHGFAKCALPAEYLERFPSAAGIDLRDVQADVVRVSTDLSREVHFHSKSYAYVICLGSPQGVPAPIMSRAFIDGGWRPLVGNERLEIPPGTPHGFTVDEGGILYFLSVQSPPIGRAGDEDDYHRIE